MLRERTDQWNGSGDQRGMNGDEYPRPPRQRAGAPDGDAEEDEARRIEQDAHALYRSQGTREDGVDYRYALSSLPSRNDRLGGTA